MSTMKSFLIPKEIVDQVQAADIEQSARREIVVSCIERGVAADSPAMKAYQEEYNEWYRKFNELKTEVENKYVTPNNTDTEVAKSWQLNYQQQTLVITY